MALGFTIDELKMEVTNGYISVQKHPVHNLYIYNYTHKTQFDSHWNNVTLNCRGLILDDNYNIVARSFSKFFNYEEIDAKKIPLVSSDYVYVQEKVDGSLGILFHYNNEWILATRGSFISDQAIRGMKIIKNNYKLATFDTSLIYLVEIIYPENKIVVDYGNEERIVFLTVFTKEYELHWTTAENIFKAFGIKDIVKCEQIFNVNSELYNKLKNRNELNKEGFVLRFFPSEFRVKIKFEEYARLHKIISGLSNKVIWEYLKDGKSTDDIIQNVPDEFYGWVNEKVDEFNESFNKIKDECNQIYNYILSQNFESKKEIAEYVNSNVKRELRGLVFNLVSGKSNDDVIWRMIKPVFEKPCIV